VVQETEQLKHSITRHRHPLRFSPFQLRTRGRHRVPCRRYSSITNRRRQGRYLGLLVHGRLLLLILPEDDIAPPLVEDPGEEDEEPTLGLLFLLLCLNPFKAQPLVVRVRSCCGTVLFSAGACFEAESLG
jgi:hypothetical protein